MWRPTASAILAVAHLLACCHLVQGQCAANTNASCEVGVYWDGEGSSEYYDPSDTDDVGIQLQSNDGENTQYMK